MIRGIPRNAFFVSTPNLVVTDALSKKWAILIIIVDMDFTNIPDVALNLCKSVADMTFSHRSKRMNTDLRFFRIFFQKD